MRAKPSESPWVIPPIGGPTPGSGAFQPPPLPPTSIERDVFPEAPKPGSPTDALAPSVSAPVSTSVLDEDEFGLRPSHCQYDPRFDPFLLPLTLTISCVWQLTKLQIDHADALGWACPKTPKERADQLREIRHAYAELRPLIYESDEQLNADDERFASSRVRQLQLPPPSPAPNPPSLSLWYSKFSGLGPPPPARPRLKTPTRSLARLSGLLDEGPHCTQSELAHELADEDGGE